MLQNILKLDGVQLLEKVQQQAITGGKRQCSSHGECGPGNCCNTAGWCQTFGSQGSTGYLCDGGMI
ncbi:hypothetical protein C8N46_11198 [Kordia periserrulae]|uniref:Uncharacterized protein n=1 Tax=Kordia periserrulae TaxID=701523 RepID=A0A2T6BSK1_9FLAO|nr:hypothetical protein [Kordia periserrulae]PTX59029.1 hypothetical protein C8N46_11198 [Kordia periserrulae]